MTDEKTDIDRKDSQRLPSYFLRITKRLIKVIDVLLSSSSTLTYTAAQEKAEDKLTLHHGQYRAWFEGTRTRQMII